MASKQTTNENTELQETFARRGTGEVSVQAFFRRIEKRFLISPPDVAVDHLFPPYTAEKVHALNQWFDY
jgi:hypothetical protein